MKDDPSTPIGEGQDSSPNTFERDKPPTVRRDLAEAAIERLRKEGGVFVNAVRATRMAMAITDPTLPGNPIVFANESFLKMSGYRMDEVLGQQPHFMNGPDTDPRDAARFVEALQTDQDDLVETVQYRKNGSRFIATVLLSAFKDEQGRTLNHFMSWLDVTRRVNAEDDVAALKAAQVALRDSEARYRTLFDSIDEGFCVVEVLFDPDEKPVDYRFLEVNGAFERQTGLSHAVGKRMRELAPEHEQLWFDIYGQVALTGNSRRFEQTAEALGYSYDVYAFRIGQPEQRRVAILFRDIGERKRVQDALRDSEARQAFLLKLSDALRPLTEPAEITEQATRILGEYMQADRTFIAMMEPDGVNLDVYHEYLRPGASSVIGHHNFDQFGAFVSPLLVEGHIMAVEDVSTLDLTAAERAHYAAVGIAAYLLVPLVRDGRFAACFTCNHQTPRTWSEADKNIVRQTADRTWAALERARAEAELRESEEERRALIAEMNEGFCILEVILDEFGNGVDYRFLETNPAFVRQGGFDPAGRLMSEIAPIEPIWPAAYGRVAVTGVPERIIDTAAAFGRVYDVYAFRIGAAADRRIAVFFSDISARKIAETELRESEERQTFLLNLSDSLRSEQSVEAVGNRAVAMISERLCVDRVYLVTLSPDDDTVVVTHEKRHGDLPALKGSYRSSDFPNAIRELFERTIVYEDVRSDQRLTDQDRESFEALNAVGFMAASIRRGRGEIIWAAGAVSTKARKWTQAEVALFENAIERTWAAVERAKTEDELRRSERLRTAMLEVLPRGLALVDRDGKTVLANAQWDRFAPSGRIPSRDHDRGLRWRSWVKDGALTERNDYPGARALRGERVDPMDFLYTGDDGTEFWTSVAAVPLRAADDQVAGAVCFIQDIDDAKRATEALQDSESHAQILLAELQHRVRNTLAVVRSIARRTAESSPESSDFMSHFEGRLNAFSRVQAVVTRSPGGSVELKSLVEDELLTLAAQQGENLRIHGPLVCLTSRAAESMSLAVHELATNAVKYGALSAPNGRIDIGWHCVPGDDVNVLKFEWREHGLETAPTAEREGFGHELLLRSLAYDLGATTGISFEQDGLRFMMTLPLTSDIVTAGPAVPAK